MVSYAFAFSQWELGKYFQWIVKVINRAGVLSFQMWKKLLSNDYVLHCNELIIINLFQEISVD